LSSAERRQPPDIVAEVVDAIVVAVTDQQDTPRGQFIFGFQAPLWLCVLARHVPLLARRPGLRLTGYVGFGDRVTVAKSAHGPRRVLVLGLAVIPVGAITLGGCRPSTEPGGFEDDLDTGEATPPDLLQSECDPRRESDCEDGSKCSYVVDPEFGPINRCVALLGDGIAGEPCEQIGDSDDCANHHLCWATDVDGLAGVCVSFCSTALTCESPLDTCAVSNGDLLSLCLPKCDPIAQDCAPGWGCYPDDYQRWACDRDRSGDIGAHGQACTCLNCCDPGLICLAGALVDGEECGAEGAPGCCAQLCALEDGAPVDESCPTELERCESFYDGSTAPLDYDHIGICQL
jgi:hypothetical protein